MTHSTDIVFEPAALSADTIIDRYRQLKADLRDHPEQAGTIQPLLEQLRSAWKAYNGDDDLPELATGPDEVS